MHTGKDLAIFGKRIFERNLRRKSVLLAICLLTRPESWGPDPCKSA